MKTTLNRILPLVWKDLNPSMKNNTWIHFLISFIFSLAAFTFYMWIISLKEPTKFSFPSCPSLHYRWCSVGRHATCQTICSLLLALVLVELQKTCKKKLNRKMLEKLRVQGCQIWHSHVSIPFNSAPAHSTRPHNAKKKLFTLSFQSKFLKIRFTKVTASRSFLMRQ